MTDEIWADIEYAIGFVEKLSSRGQFKYRAPTRAGARPRITVGRTVTGAPKWGRG